MAKTFEAQLSDWAKRTELRAEAVAKSACQMLVSDMTTPRGSGGNMPVDTGFLRNSGLSALNAIPSGESNKANFQATARTINKLKIGDRFYYGWVANYAKYMEARYAFMRLAAQDWESIVFRAAEKTKAEYDN